MELGAIGVGLLEGVQGALGPRVLAEVVQRDGQRQVRVVQRRVETFRRLEWLDCLGVAPQLDGTLSLEERGASVLGRALAHIAQERKRLLAVPGGGQALRAKPTHDRRVLCCRQRWNAEGQERQPKQGVAE